MDARLALIDVRGWPVAPDPIDRHHIERRHCSRCRGSGRCTGGSRAQHHPPAPRKIADRKRTGRGARASKRRPSRCPTARNLTANCQGTARIHAPLSLSPRGGHLTLSLSSLTLMGEGQKESRKSLAPNDKTLCVPVSRRAIQNPLLLQTKDQGNRAPVHNLILGGAVESPQKNRETKRGGSRPKP